MKFEKIYGDMNLQELEKNLQNITFQLEISFSDLVEEIYAGNQKGVLAVFINKIKEEMRNQWCDIKNIIITVVIVILVSALLSTFKDAFQNAQIAEISFYINYLLLSVIFINLFGNILAVGESSLKKIL